MKISQVKKNTLAFAIEWSDGSRSQAPFIWLRDNDQQELHPQTGERIFDLTSVDLDIQPESFDFTEAGLTISWPNKQTPSKYTAEWLFAHRPGKAFDDPAVIQKQSWTAAQQAEPPRFSAKACYQDETALKEALITLKTTGIILIDELDDYKDAGFDFGDLIGFKRETNFGVSFEVVNKPNPNNLAYTALALPLHTDLPNQELVPGIQFLHCFKNSATGGGSVFADAMAIVEDFERDCPEHFKTLVEFAVPWRFHDQTCDIRRHRPVIGLDKHGTFKTLTFNAHLGYTPDFEPEMMYPFYAAFRELMKRIRNEKYRIEYELKPGQMVVFDNQRALHGRAEFDPNSGERYLRGYYIEHNEVDSRLRMLHKAHCS